MANLIFKKDWDKLSFVEFKKLCSTEFLNANSLPCEKVYAAICKQKIATLQLLEVRETLSTFRIWQTDEVFLSNDKENFYKTFENSNAYFKELKTDALIKRYFKKKPVFIGIKISDNKTLIKHCRTPFFSCLYTRNIIIETKFNYEPNSVTYPDRELINKCDAFYRSYFLIL